MEVTAQTQQQARRRKVSALLAGGLVLGVGAAVTLAAWNDSEFAVSNFSAGSFALEGSTDGVNFENHDSANGAASLTFTTPVTNLSPEDVVYAPFALKVTGTSDAALTSNSPVADGTISENLAFETVATTTFGCDASAFDAGTVVPQNIDQDEVVNLCLKVSATSDLEQGQSGTVLWQWEATSTN